MGKGWILCELFIHTQVQVLGLNSKGVIRTVIFFEYKTNGANSFNCSERKLKIFPDSHLRARRTIKKIDFGAPFRSSCGPIRIKPFVSICPPKENSICFHFPKSRLSCLRPPQIFQGPIPISKCLFVIFRAGLNRENVGGEKIRLTFPAHRSIMMGALISNPFTDPTRSSEKYGSIDLFCRFHGLFLERFDLSLAEA